MKDVLHLANQAWDSITAQDWKRCIHHVENIMLDDFNRVARNEVTEYFTINLSEISDNDSDRNDCDTDGE